MRPLSYFAPALVPRTDPKIVDNAACTKDWGLPGAVYICKDHECVWYPPAISTQCMSYAGLALPTLIGPDPSGYCLLFKDAECKDMVTPFPDRNDIVCPGIDVGIPNTTRGMICYGCVGECHPPRMGEAAHRPLNVGPDDLINMPKPRTSPVAPQPLYTTMQN